jgi:hypothetical protein
VLLAGCLKDVDARDKPGHDKSGFWCGNHARRGAERLYSAPLA